MCILILTLALFCMFDEVSGFVFPFINWGSLLWCDHGGQHDYWVLCASMLCFILSDCVMYCGFIYEFL